MWVTVCFSANIKINHPEVIKWHSLSGVCLVLTEPDMLFPSDPTSTCLSIHPRELKTYVHTKTCTQKFMAASFPIAKSGGHQDVLQWVNGEINCGTSMQWNITQC